MLKANSRHLALIAGVAVLAGGCNTPAGSPSANLAATPSPTTQAPVTAPITSEHEPFNAQLAMAILRKQCDFGVRPLGSAAHETTKDYLIAQMKLYAAAR